MSSVPLHIAYCGNESVFPHILLSVLSIAKVTPAPVTVHFLTMDLSDEDERFVPVTEKEFKVIEEALKRGNPASGLRVLDGREAYLRELKSGKNHRNHYTPYAMGRLLLSEFDMPERLLYLDSDIMCCSDLSAFLAIDLEPYEFAAVVDEMGKFWIRRDYCNSGAMYLNMKRVRETRLLERAREMVNTKRMAFPDQTSLNRLVHDKLILPRRFNEQRAIREDTVLKHFCRGIRWLPFFKVYNYKQNDVKNVHGKLGIFCFDDVYREYDLLAEEYGLPPLKR